MTLGIDISEHNIGNEGLSIVENAAKAGVPVPKRLRDTLEQLTKEREAKK